MSLTRHPKPFLIPQDIPALRADLRDVSSVFNPGAVRWRGRELLLLRVQTRGRTTLLVPAEVHDDERVEFLGLPVEVPELDPVPAHLYDARLTVLEDTLYAVCAADFPEGCHLVILRTTDFEHWEIAHLDRTEDQRNGVVFPERVGGRILRLQRPNRHARAGGPPTGNAITLSSSQDWHTWNEHGVVLQGRPQRWDEWVGSGPPPVKTRNGWLHVYHGVATHFASANIYQAGVVLLDLNDPQRVVARGAFNILEPRTSWECTGQVPNVVFPSGMVVDEVDAEGFALPDSGVRIYYGAADTVVGLATTTIQSLVEEARFAG